MPKDFLQPSFHIATEAFKMSEEELYETAKVVTEIRKGFRKKAKEVV